MTPVATLRGQRVAVFGLGGSGPVDGARAGRRRRRSRGLGRQRDGARTRGRGGLPLVDLAERRLARASTLFVLVARRAADPPEPHWTVEPRARGGGPDHRRHRALRPRARARGRRDAPFVAITGTNGKSTTTALIAHRAEEAGRDVAIGGNIGVPVLDLPPPAAGRTHVIECSSYPDRPRAVARRRRVGLLINITPDHLDRHGDHGELCGDQGAARRAVRGRARSASTTSLAARSAARLKARGGSAAGRRGLRGSIAARRRLRRAIAGSWSRRATPRWSIWPARARCAARTTGRTPPSPTPRRGRSASTREAIARGLRVFPGLAHRMEEVGRRGRVLFINNSKATNADAAEKALMSFRRHPLDLGGKAEGGRHRAAAPAVPARRQSLSDRRGERRFRAHARRRRSVRAMRDARARRSRRPPRRGAVSAQRAGRVAVAGLRIVRPVRQFRGARRGVPRLGRRMARARRPSRHARKRSMRHGVESERGPVADWMRTVDRWLLGSFGALMVIGLVMALAASPAVAERLNLSTVPFRRPAGVDADPDGDPDDRDVVPVAAARAPRGA